MLCNNVTKEIWEFCIKRGAYISSAHIPAKENIVDLVPKEFQHSHKWLLSMEVFK